MASTRTLEINGKQYIENPINSGQWYTYDQEVQGTLVPTQDWNYQFMLASTEAQDVTG